MNFSDYQEKQSGTAIFEKTMPASLTDYSYEVVFDMLNRNQFANLSYIVLGLVGEAGEIANKLKKVWRDDDVKITDDAAEKLKDELGDVLWYCSAMCNFFGWNLEDVANQNIAKLQNRKENDTLKGSGDNR